MSLDSSVLEKEGGTNRQEKWQASAQVIAEIEAHDPHQLKVDEHVRGAVVGLSALDFKTTISCEGHVDHGPGVPYIKLAHPEVFDKAQGSKDAFIMERHTDHARLQAEIIEHNNQELTRLQSLLDAFYENREISPDVQLTAQIEFDRIRLQNRSDASYKNAQPENKRAKLLVYQKEMVDFGAFLETKFFSGD